MLINTISRNRIMGAVFICLRAIQNLRQEDMRNKLGMSQSSVARLENGESDVSVNELRQIAKMFNSDAISLLTLAESLENKLVGFGIKIEDNYIPSQGETTLSIPKQYLLSVAKEHLNQTLSTENNREQTRTVLKAVS